VLIFNILLFVLQEIPPTGFWEGFRFGASAHSMVIAAFGSLLGEAILALNAYRQHNGLPPYYQERGFWVVRLIVVLGATVLPWAQGMKDVGVDPLVPFEIGLCGELLLSRIMGHR
jgi:uncharacterized membrane protein YjfL (UPF0719 family)